jgi:hypothetical protein
MPENHQVKHRTLIDICNDIAFEKFNVIDRNGARNMLEGFIRESLHTSFLHLETEFEDALKYLKSELYPCRDLFTDIELRRIIGTETAWSRKIMESSNLNTTKTRAERDAEREVFLRGVFLGAEPKEDSASPKSQMMELETYIRSWSDFPAFGFGVRALEDATGGILPGELCVLTGAPGTMKTSLALCAVDDFVSRTEVGSVYYCSVDMAPREITHRLVEREALIPQAILTSMIARDDPEFAAIKQAISDKYDGRLVIRGHSETRPLILDAMLLECLERQPQLIILDYFTRLKQPGQSDLEFVEYAMPKILQYAHQYQASFLILSQMSRSSRAEQATGRTGGHGKGGGIVEELAHTEIELIQQSVEGDKPLVIAAVTKARRGISGQYFSLDYDGPIKRFTGKARKMSKAAQKKAIFEPSNDSFYGSAS